MKHLIQIMTVMALAGFVLCLVLPEAFPVLVVLGIALITCAVFVHLTNPRQ